MRQVPKADRGRGGGRAPRAAVPQRSSDVPRLPHGAGRPRAPRGRQLQRLRRRSRVPLPRQALLGATHGEQRPRRGANYKEETVPHFTLLQLPPVYVSQQPSPTPIVYVPPNQQLQVPPQWQWPPPPPPQQQQLIYPPAAAPPVYPQTLMVPIQDANSGGGEMACAYLGHDAATIQ